MAYKWIEQYDSPNFGYPRGRTGQNKPVEIIIHHWGIDGQSFDSVCSWLCRERAMSGAHLVVEDGRVACLIPYNCAAWGSGDYYHNCESIQIECRPECTDGDIATLEEVIADLYDTYGILPLIGHKDVKPTDCPGRYYGRLAEIQAAATAIYNGTKRVGWIRDNIGWYYTLADGSYLKARWEKLNGEWYYFDTEGYAVTGWRNLDSKWYYFNSDCKMVTGWQSVNGKWYYFEPSGDMRTGWVKWRDRWYYLREKDGDMISDEFRKVGGDWYRFDASGAMLEKTTLQVGSDGAIK